MGRKIIIGIIAIAIVLMLILVIYLGIGADETWDTPFNDGELKGIWEEQILLTYADGTVQSLKILEDNIGKSFTAVKYNEQTVTRAEYVIYATITGGGYAEWEIGALDIKKAYYSGSSVFDVQGISIPANIIDSGVRTKIASSVVDLATEFGELQPTGWGLYSISWTPQVSSSEIQFKGLPVSGTGYYKTVASPPGKTLTFFVMPPNQILLQLVET